MTTLNREHRRLTAHVVGRVQGVGFRHFTSTRARSLGLKGWVRNEYDGSVRFVAEGPPEKLERLLEDVRRGPGTARVDEVVTDWAEASGEFGGFDVRF